MFARSSTIHAQADMIDAGMAHLRDSVMPMMSHLDGFVGLSVMLDPATGRCIATSAWRSEHAMTASADRVAPIRDGAAQAFGGTATAETWEVAMMHRAHHARPGTCMRATWGRIDIPQLDSAVDTFKFATLAEIEDLPGFCSASLMLDRTDGRVVVTVGYDDREMLALSRQQGASIRAESAMRTGMDVLDVGEFDLAMAHLHVPEMI